MLEEFAITPECFSRKLIGGDSAQQQALTQILSGLCENGLLANLHDGKWHTAVTEQQAKSLPDTLRDAILSQLKFLLDHGRIVKHNSRGRSAKCEIPHDWLEAAIATHQAKHFHGIVSTASCKKLEEASGIPAVALKEVLGSTVWRSRSDNASVDVRKTFEDFRNKLRPLLRYARWVRLADPYFDIRPVQEHESNYLRTLQLCRELLGCGFDNKPTNMEIQVHSALREGKRTLEVRDKNPSNEQLHMAQVMLDEWESIARPGLNPGPSIIFVVWANRLGRRHWDRLHDRFIFTNQSAVGVPGGLDCWEETGAETSFDWKTNEQQRAIHKKFERGSSDFVFVDKREVTASAN